MYQQKGFLCVRANTLHVQTPKELLSCSSMHNFPSLQNSFQSNPILPSILFFLFFPTSLSSIPVLSCPFAHGEAGIISYTWHGARCGTAVMQASAQGFCVQKIQLKNNYQKISGSPVRLYCLNRCFLFICCNNRMLF